jgi:hypothetical protein
MYGIYEVTYVTHLKGLCCQKSRSVRLYASYNSRFAERIFVKFDAHSFSKISPGTRSFVEVIQ